MSGPVTPALGSVLGGRYRLEQVVGRGGMADVYRAVDDLLGRTVAVKLMRAGADSEGERMRIEVEMRTLAGLRHPGLVTLFDASAGDDSSGGAPYLVMDYIDGPTLRQRTGTGPLSPLEAAGLGHDVALALRYVHQNGVVHRDVKPANILLDRTEDGLPAARLTDFGIAQVAEHTRHTVEGTTIGTANYLSPEQARGQALSAASDTYSFGLVLLEMLTGELAFPGTGIETAVARLHRDPLVPASLEPRWQDVLRAMTAQRPEDRPDDAWVAHQLAVLAGRPVAAPEPATVLLAAVPPTTDEPTQAVGLGGGTAVLAGPPAGDTALLVPERRRSRRGAWLLATAAAVVVAAVVLAVVLSGSGSGPRASAGATSSPSGSTAPASSGIRSSATASTHASTRSAATSYTDVDGRLGRDLRRAEAVLRPGGAGLDTVRADLQRLAKAAAAGNTAAARSALDDVETDAAAAAAAGSLSTAALAELRSITSSLSSDLRRTAAASSSAHEASRTTSGPAAPAGPGKGKQGPPGQQKKSGGPPGPGGP